MLRKTKIMKTKKVLNAMLVLFLLLSGMGCEKETDISILCHTWKFEGFGNSSNSSFEKAEPSDCEKCYVIKFVTDRTVSGFTASNTFFGEYQINGKKLMINNFSETEIFESGNGEKYSRALSKIASFEIIKNELKLYYNQGRDYLLFYYLN